MILNLNNVDTLKKYFKFVLGILVTIGVIMVYSSSYMYAKEKFGSSTHFFFKQMIFMAIACGGAVIVAKTKYKFWYKYSYYLNMAASALLVLTFIPGIGTMANGSNRWISLGPMTLQPGEFLKYTILLSSLFFFDNFFKMEMKSRIRHGISLLVPLLLLVLQPDFGTFSICFAVMAFTCFLSSFPRKYFYSGFAIGTVMALVILISQPYRVRRLMTYLDPWKNPQGSGFQIIQSWIGFANGGFFGKGPGNSIEKLFYLPEAHNDFIFSVIGEEFGFIGVMAIVGLFLFLIYLGLRLSLVLKNRTGYLIITSIIFTVGLQAVLNMGVVLGLLPTKGLNLPFISYGGSSLLANFFGIGLIFSVIKGCTELNGALSRNDTLNSSQFTQTRTGSSFQTARSVGSSTLSK